MRKICLAAALTLLIGLLPVQTITTATSTCPDVKIIYARGSGASLENDGDYAEFQRDIEAKISKLSLRYKLEYLDYPAVGVGLDHLGTTLGAYVGRGESYDFGDSVEQGAKKLFAMVNDRNCRGMKFVLVGYSQGALVVHKILPYMSEDRLIYAAFFGDPKIYLPEGEGRSPKACQGQDLSAYRIYVPNCTAYKGLLGSIEPYVPSALAGKVGTWCNKDDIMCSSKYNIDSHTAYVADGLIEDISRVIYVRVKEAFGLENDLVVSPHDTVFLFDSTASMSSMLEYYRTEAIRLATKTLKGGGRIALYDYRDLDDPYTPVQHCSFDDCTLEKFTQEVSEIELGGGGDTPESLLSAAMTAMRELDWRYGTTKSLIALTDADYLSPDRDGTTYEQVVKMSQKIDPVNIYVITEDWAVGDYVMLSEATGGKAINVLEGAADLTDYIMERVDSLPRVEEEEVLATLPVLTIHGAANGPEGVTVKFSTDAEKAIVILDDVILGTTSERSITFQGLRAGKHTVGLAPVDGGKRGETELIDFDVAQVSEAEVTSPTNLGPAAEIEAEGTLTNHDAANITIGDDRGAKIVVPKAPNTGRR